MQLFQTERNYFLVKENSLKFKQILKSESQCLKMKEYIKKRRNIFKNQIIDFYMKLNVLK